MYVAAVGMAVAVMAEAVAGTAVAVMSVAEMAVAVTPGPMAVTLHERLAGLRHLLHHILHQRRTVERRQGDGGPREQEVAEKHGRLRREELVDGGASAACGSSPRSRQLAALDGSCCCLLLA